MSGFGFVTPEQYEASFTADSIAGLRARAREVATRLRQHGVAPEHLDVVDRRVEFPKRVLGFRVKPDVRIEREVRLSGWMLAEVITLVGEVGDEWFQWRVACVLDPSGELLRVERHSEERRGIPTSDDGTIRVSPVEDRELDLWDHMDPKKYRETAPPGFWDLFPGRLGRALDELSSAPPTSSDL